jgi:hypothetical protein
MEKFVEIFKKDAKRERKEDVLKYNPINDVCYLVLEVKFW